MRFRLANRLVSVVLALSLLGSACEPGESVSGAGEGELVLSVAALLEAAQIDRALHSDVRSVHVRLYAGSGAAEELAFDSGCTGHSGDRLRISSLKIRDDYRVQVDLFDDTRCESLAFRGVRGGIAITTSAGEDNPYVIPIVAVDEFSVLPGRAREHFPLSPWRPRAFHAAVPLDDGRVAFIGGAETTRNHDFIGGEGGPEILDTRSMLFSRRAGGDLGSHRMMAHAATRLPNGLLAVAGGVQAFRLSRNAAGRLDLQIPNVICYSDPCDDVNYVQQLRFVDLPRNVATSVTLRTARVFPTLDVVRQADGDAVILAGGIPGTFDTNPAFRCLFSPSGGVECDTLPLSSFRSGHASACVRRDPAGDPFGDCTSLAYLGGAEVGRSFLEWISSASGEFNPAVVDSAPSTTPLLLPRAAGTAGLIFVTGGALGRSPTADSRASAGAITLSATGAGFFEPVPLGAGLPTGAGDLLFHTVTPLDDRHILVAGGLTPANEATDTAFILRPDGNTFVVTQVLRLQQARFGHTATRVEGGPLHGAVIIMGGVRYDSEGLPRLIDTTEMLLPSFVL